MADTRNYEAGALLATPLNVVFRIYEAKIFINTLFYPIQWLRCGFGLVYRFIGSSIVVTIIISYALKITVTIARVTSRINSSNASCGHTAVPLELRNSSEANSHARIISYPLGTDHAEETQFYCYVPQITQKTCHVVIISPVHWRADCCLEKKRYLFVLLLRDLKRGVYRAVAYLYTLTVFSFLWLDSPIWALAASWNFQFYCSY
jgi:hypothetical protein